MRNVNGQPIRILIVEDDADDFLILRDCILDIPERSFQIDWTYKYEDALDHLRSGHYDMYFLDYLLGERTGLELLKDAIRDGCEEPIVLLTGVGIRELDIEAMTNGAIDYLVKSEINIEKLERCIRYSLERSSYIRALKTNERKFRMIFERSKDAVFLADENLVFQDVNLGTSELLKYERSELLEISLFSLFAKAETVESVHDKLIRTGEVEDEEVELIIRNKERRQCVLSISRESFANGKPYWQGIIHDITNLKKIERATFQIEKLRSTATLLRTLAHEVRNPLTNINLSVEELKSEITSGDASTYLEIIARNCGRIDGLISELLDLSRPVEITLRRTILQELIENTLTVAADRVALKGILLELKYPEIPAMIMADTEKLKIALLNIIINAIEAVPGNSGKITIGIKEETPFYKLKISDNGSGISEDNLSRIFEPYFTTKTNGFGLGLSATWNIIQSHGAGIEVSSLPGEGTSFVLTFGQLEE